MKDFQKLSEILSKGLTQLFESRIKVLKSTLDVLDIEPISFDLPIPYAVVPKKTRPSVKKTKLVLPEKKVKELLKHKEAVKSVTLSPAFKAAATRKANKLVRESASAGPEVILNRVDRFKALLATKTGTWSKDTENDWICIGRWSRSNSNSEAYEFKNTTTNHNLVVALVTLLSKWKHTP